MIIFLCELFAFTMIMLSRLKKKQIKKHKFGTVSLLNLWLVIFRHGKSVQCSSDPEFAFSNVSQTSVNILENLNVHYSTLSSENDISAGKHSQTRLCWMEHL